MNTNNTHFEEEGFLFGTDKRTPFVLPNGYFDTLYARILNRIECEKELAEFKTLAENKKRAFTVPADYFSNLEYKQELKKYPELENISKPSFKKLPDTYFESLNKKVADKIELENELKEFSALSAIPKKNNFKTASTFAASKTTKETIQPPKTIFKQLVVSMYKPPVAIAAGLILTLGFSAFWYYNQQETKQLKGDCMTLACLEKNEILNDKNISDFDEENIYEMVDVDALDQQLSANENNEDSLNTNK
jgi:hypothetical protein